MRTISNSIRIVCLLGVALAAGSSPAPADTLAAEPSAAPAETLDCSDVGYDLTIWYTAGNAPPDSGGDCTWPKRYKYHEGQCGIFCGTDNCGWGAWEYKLRRRALNQALFEVGYTFDLADCDTDETCRQRVSECTAPLTLWGADISDNADSNGGLTRDKWSLASDP